MNSFEKAIAEVLEVEAVSPDTAFRDVPGWCSLKAFGLLVVMENDWSAPLSVARLQELETVRDLFLEAFLAFAAGVLKVPRAALAPGTAHGSIPEWDSIAHLRLVMEAERRFGVAYPLERIPALATLADFCSI